MGVWLEVELHMGQMFNNNLRLTCASLWSCVADLMTQEHIY
jgi:hypothetical protein